MLLNQDLYTKLNAYLGIESGNGAPDTDNRVLEAINATFQQVYSESPYFIRKTIAYDGNYGPPQLVLSDLEIGSDTPSLHVVLPGNLGEMVFMPLAAMQLSTYPNFVEEKRAYVQVVAAAALDYLRKLTPTTQATPLVFTGMPQANGMIYNRLLRYLSLEPGNSTPDTDQVILEAMNRGLIDLWTKGPFFLRRSPGAATVANPIQVTFNVTQGSTAITGISGFTSKMIGCALRIGGEPGDNEFIDGSTLVVPITQESGQVTATVYFNCITLPPGVTSVAGDVYLDGWRQLDPLFYEEHQLFADTHSREMLDYSGAYILTNSGYQRLKVGVPTGYYVRPASVQTGPYYLQQIRFWPLPGNSHSITWINETSAPKLAMADLQIGNLTPTDIVPLPGDSHDASWLPLAALALTTDYRFDKKNLGSVEEAATKAFDYLKLLEPQRQGGAMLRPRTRLPNT